MAFSAGDRVSTQITTRVLSTYATDVPNKYCTSYTLRVLGIYTPCVFAPHCMSWMAENLNRSTHRFATLWTITRADAQVFRFTDHIGALTDRHGETFTPIGGPAVTAKEHAGGAREHTAEMMAAMVVGGAEMDDLEAGLWEDAEAIEVIVDWRYPWAGCFKRHRWWLRDVQWDGEKWTAQLGGYASRFQRPRGDVYSSVCGHDFGDGFGQATTFGCMFDVASTQESGTVSALVSPLRTFQATGLTPAHVAEYFVAGQIVWTGGDNTGHKSAVRKQTEGSGYYELEIELSLPQAIQVGDTFTIVQGCQKRLVEDCIPRGQVINFGGFPFMPGADKIGQVHA
jgi:uncharacterized phage protein (TIGR02218 family)